MNKYLKVIVAVMVLSVSVAFLALVYGDRVIFSFYGGGLVFNYSTSMKVHKISVGGREFCVPEAYFRFSNSFYSDSDMGVDLNMEIDSLLPWNIYGEKSGFFLRKKGMSIHEVNQVQSKMMGLKIRGGKGEGYLSERLKFFLNGMSVREEGGYNRLVRNEKSISLYEYYLVPKGREYSYVIGCNSGARCELETFYDGSLDYTVSFDERYLDDVKYTDEKVRGLIGSLVCI